MLSRRVPLALVLVGLGASPSLACSPSSSSPASAAGATSAGDATDASRGYTAPGFDQETTQAAGGGVCCRVGGQPTCEGAWPGGWAPSADGCPAAPSGVDEYLVPSTDVHGCIAMHPGACGCECCGHERCPRDADGGQACPTGMDLPATSGSDCAPAPSLDRACAPAGCPAFPPHAYVCQSGAPPVNGCKWVPDEGLFCCPDEACTRSPLRDPLCGGVAKYYVCPTVDGGALPGPGTCTTQAPAGGDTQDFCCE